MTRVLFLALLLLNFASPAFAQTANEKAEALLLREMRERRIPGLQAAVVRTAHRPRSDLTSAAADNANMVSYSM